ncbi:hypothetical protein [Phocaeicola oris]|uniref:hypothetical protein n=1 Tax=Phocaeicola oris TaxID=2896850 RepID=UPI00234E7A3A|nr:hypothetical protein [Phocaeicola oris]MCE2615326.1 hypothetical protein [Phocaeicola oris]
MEIENFKLIPLCEEDMKQFKHDIQEAFQYGAEDVMGKVDGEILPEKDINMCLAMKDAAAYEAIVNGTMVGGAIVVIDKNSQHNELGFLFVKRGVQSRGVLQQTSSKSA